MSKKSLFIILTVALSVLAGIAVSAICVKNSDNASFDLMEENIEVLSDSEFNPVQSCNDYCVTSSGKKCVLLTNQGFNIICHDIKEWL